MLEQLPEVVGELLPLAGRLVVGLVMTVLGLGLEANAVGTWSGGETALALWFAYMGCVALYAAVSLLGRVDREDVERIQSGL